MQILPTQDLSLKCKKRTETADLKNSIETRCDMVLGVVTNRVSSSKQRNRGEIMLRTTTERSSLVAPERQLNEQLDKYPSPDKEDSSFKKTRHRDGRPTNDARPYKFVFGDNVNFNDTHVEVEGEWRKQESNWILRNRNFYRIQNPNGVVLRSTLRSSGQTLQSPMLSLFCLNDSCSPQQVRV